MCLAQSREPQLPTAYASREQIRHAPHVETALRACWESRATAARTALSPASVNVVVWVKVRLLFMAAASLQAQPPSWLGPQSAPAARRACRVFPHSQPAHRSRSSVGPARAAAALATAITVSRRQNGRGRSVAFAEGPMAGWVPHQLLNGPRCQILLVPRGFRCPTSARARPVLTRQALCSRCHWTMLRF